MLNSHLIGRIGKDAEIRNNDGKSYMTMDVATDYFSKGENKTMWVRIISIDPTVIEKRAQYFKKGSLVTIEGQQLLPQTPRSRLQQTIMMICRSDTTTDNNKPLP